MHQAYLGAGGDKGGGSSGSGTGRQGRRGRHSCRSELHMAPVRGASVRGLFPRETPGLHLTPSRGRKSAMIEEEPVEEILDDFEAGSGYQRQAVDAALEFRDETVPHLLALLQRVVDEPGPWLEEPFRVDHWYAALVLGYLGDADAHGPLIELLSLPDEQSFELFADMVAKLFPAFLYRTAAGSFERVEGLLRDRQADPLSRDAAARSLIYAYAAGVIDREEVVTRLGRALAQAQDEGDVEGCTMLANALCDIGPAELMPQIQQGYENGLIDSSSLELKDFEEEIERGERALVETLRQEIATRTPADIHGWMGNWSVFDGESD